MDIDPQVVQVAMLLGWIVCGALMWRYLKNHGGDDDTTAT